jgi:ABC-type oligopeptide transport system substrate-binding subunit
LLHCILNAEQISGGKLHPNELAVRAVEPFQLRIELRSETPFFLQVLSHRVCSVTPRRAIEKHGASWTDPARIVSNGAFILKERRTNDRVMLARNPHYYEAAVVALDELEFQVVVDGAAAANLYRTGAASVAQPLLPHLLPALSRKRDFRAYPMFGLVFPLINTTIPPLDDVRVRYALNMSIDKRALAQFAGAGRMEAPSLVPPLEGYASSRELPVSIDGAMYDVLSYNPDAARELFRKAGHDVNRRLPIQFLLPKLPDARPVSEILQQQWRHVLGIELVFANQDLQTWLQTVFTRAFRGIAFWGDTAGYVDPTWFLDQFKGSSPANPTGWADSRFEALLAEAAATSGRAARMRKLHESECQLLRGMPCLPLYTDAWTYLRKPFVQGLGANTLDIQQWKYARIDTNWRP